MIEVRIRRALEGTPAHLCDWPADRLDQLIPTVEKWGIEGEWPTLAGQFAISDGSAYFELIVEEVDE